MTGESSSGGVGRDDLDECWCCDGLHDGPGLLCPSCDDAGCQYFDGECRSGHKPVLPDGGGAGHSEPGTERESWWDRTGVAIALVVFFITGFVGFEVFTMVSNPDKHCNEYGNSWTGQWVNETKPPKGEYGIVCTAPNGSTINDTVKEANAAEYG